MAVAAPVYERSIGKDAYVDNNYNSQMSDDEFHNAQIKGMYEKLMDPKYKMSDLQTEMDKISHPNMAAAQPQPVMQAQPSAQAQPAVRPQPVYAAPAAEANTANPVYWVQGARADSELFRADSEINKAFLAQYGAQASSQTAQPAYAPAYVQESNPVQQTPVIEEENDDLRPTRTTIQYQTIDANGARISDSVFNAYREGEIPRPEEDAETHSKITFTKRDKVIMGVVLGLILSVFVLIIVNSAIISSINTDIASLDIQLEAAKQSFEQTMADLDNVSSYENVYQYAVENGIVK